MAADVPPHRPNPQPDDPRSSTYSSRRAASLFNAFLRQSDPALQDPRPPPASTTSGSASSTSSLTVPPIASSPSIGSESSSLDDTILPPPVTDMPVSIGKCPIPKQASGPLNQHKDGHASADSPGNKYIIQLAADQPLTAHGKPRERVYLACLQCRNRKVRCDGAKPECSGCLRRADPTAGPCSYDSAPRRRGKDRTPGSRRLAPLEPKKTRTTRSRVEEDEKRKKAQAAQASQHPSRHPSSVPAPQTQHAPASQGPPSRGSMHATPSTVSPEPIPPSRPDPPVQLTFTANFGPLSGLSLAHHHPTPAIPVEPQIVTVTMPVQSHLEPIELRDFDLTFAPPDAVALARLIEQEEDSSDLDSDSAVSTSPSVQFTRETWWDALLASYSGVPAGALLTADMRDATIHVIFSDLRFLFQNSLHWFAFVNIPRFFARFWDPYHRQTVQPALIFSALGLSTFFQSSELERGVKGREKALQLIDQAHAMFDASLNSGWIDVGLVQAAWLLAMFEIQAHPKANTPRTRSAFKTLDSLIRSLSLTTLDVADPRACVFMPGQVPMVSTIAPSVQIAPPPLAFDNVVPALNSPAVHHPQYGLVHDYSDMHTLAPPVDNSQWQCGCSSYFLGSNWPVSADLVPTWTCTPMWPKGVDEGEMQKEECRRLVWSTVMLTVSHNTKTTAGTDREPQHLWIKDPANYALLFPGESLAPTGMTTTVPLSKDSIWALYTRVLLLWHSALRQRSESSSSDGDRAAYAMGAWLELDNVEACLDRHTCDCGIDTGFMTQMREVLFNTRMVVSNEFKRYIPQVKTANGQLFYRDKAERWMTYMLGSAQHFLQDFKGAGGVPSNNNRRCLLLFWFMSQITRALTLWYADPTLLIALDVAKTFAPCVEFMMMIWPSSSQRKEYEGLRSWLIRSCMIAGVPLPERAIPFMPARRQ